MKPRDPLLLSTESRVLRRSARGSTAYAAKPVSCANFSKLQRNANGLTQSKKRAKPMSSDPPRTPPEVAEWLRVRTDKVRGWIKSGELAAVDVSESIGGRPRWRIFQDDVNKIVYRDEQGYCCATRSASGVRLPVSYTLTME